LYILACSDRAKLAEIHASAVTEDLANLISAVSIVEVSRTEVIKGLAIGG